MVDLKILSEIYRFYLHLGIQKQWNFINDAEINTFAKYNNYKCTS